MYFYVCLQSYILMQFSQMSNFLYLMMTLVFYFYVLFCILVQRYVYIVINKNTSIQFLNKTDFRHHKFFFIPFSILFHMEPDIKTFFSKFNIVTSCGFIGWVCYFMIFLGIIFEPLSRAKF